MLLKKQHRHVCDEFKTVDSIVHKLSKRLMEFERIWSYLQKYLYDKNIRMVYKMLGIKMP